MIKFFRKIRQQLLSQNRFSKYMLYAIGEIVLVIIGILIALNLNKQSEQKQAEAKIDAIFVDVLDELGDNIARTNELIKYYKPKDSVLHLVLHDKLTYDDYTNSDLDGIFYVTNNYRTVEVNRLAFDVLLPNIDAIPERYNDVVKKLTFLHTRRKNLVDNNNEKMINLTHKILSAYSAKYDWHSFLGPMRENKGKIDYMLNSFIYKNEAYDYRLFGIQNHLITVVNYRKGAVDLYQKLATLLDKPTIHESFKIDEDIANLFVGEWKNINNDNKVEFTFENNKLFGQSSRFNAKWELVILSSKKLTSKTIVNTFNGRNYATQIIEKDTLKTKLNGGIFKLVRVSD